MNETICEKCIESTSWGTKYALYIWIGIFLFLIAMIILSLIKKKNAK